MSTILWGVAVLLFASFMLVVFRGAPYVPTRGRDLDDLFKLYRFKKSDLLIDLGSGDGRILLAAASRGIRSLGYELNPLLVWLSQRRLARFSGLATVKLADFWLAKLPDETAVVFVFLADPFMKKLDAKLQHEATRLGHDIILVSYGPKIPGKTPEKTQGGFLSYRYKA